MSIKCLQQNNLPPLKIETASLPDVPYVTLTEVACLYLFAAPLSAGHSGTLREHLANVERKNLRTLGRSPSGQQKREAESLRTSVERFYVVLSHALANEEISLWGRPSIGDDPSIAQHQKISPEYLLEDRHHDLTENDLVRELPTDEEGLFQLIYNRDARTCAAREVKYSEVKLSAQDAANLLAKCTTPISSSTRSTPGRPPKFDYAFLRTKTDQLLMEYGSIDRNGLDQLNSKEALIEALQESHQEKHGTEPSRRTLQPHVNKWIREYESKVADN